MKHEETIADLAGRFGVSAEAVRTVASALRRSGGRLAQFDHPDLGGRGQWMPGMTQIGEMFNDRLKARVAGLCEAIAAGMSDEANDASTSTGGRRPPSRRETMEPMKPLTGMRPMEPMRFETPWWPAELGEPASAGSQNDLAYAYFADRDRLLVKRSGAIETYDTGGQRIAGIAQAQGDAGQIVFRSDRGEITLSSLRKVESA